MPSKPLLAILGATALLCGVGGFGLFRAGERVVHYRIAEDERAEAERAYRAAGLPWTAADLAPRRLDPRTTEAAALIRRARRAVPSRQWSRDAQTLRDLVDADDLAHAGAMLATYAPTLARLERAAAIGRVDFGRDLDLGVFVRVPEYSYLRSGVKMLGSRAPGVRRR